MTTAERRGIDDPRVRCALRTVPLRREREAVSKYGRTMLRDALAVGTYGNLSVRRGRRLAITPSDIEYAAIAPGDVCVVDLEGQQTHGAWRSSSELPAHLEIYRAYGAGAIVHTHSPYATAVACVRDELPACHYAAAQFGGAVRVAPAMQPGTVALADAVVEALRGRTAALLAGHGAFTIGETLEIAYERALTLEWVARVYAIASSMGSPPTVAVVRGREEPVSSPSRSSATPLDTPSSRA